MRRRYLIIPTAGLLIAGIAGGLAATTSNGYAAAPPSGMTSCAGLKQAASCHWPSARNTGVPAGTTLTTLTAANVPQTGSCKSNSLSGGQLSIYCAGTTVDSFNINEINVFVSAPDVTFTRDLIQTHSYGQIDSNVVLVDYNKPGAHLAMYDSTVNGYGYLGNNYHVIAYGDFSAVRVNAFGGTDAVAYVNGGTLIEDSFFHSAYACEAYLHPTSGTSDCGIHADVLQKSEGSNDAVIHNTIESNHYSLTSGIQCCTDQGSVNNWTVQNNLFLTDGWQMYGGYPGQNAETNVTYTGNHFTLNRPSEKGPVVYSQGPGITFNNNIVDATGVTVSN